MKSGDDMKKIIVKAIAIFVLLVMLLNLGACANTEKPSDKSETIRATVVEIEKYGHAVLDISTADFKRYCFDRARKMRDTIKYQLGLLDIEYSGKDLPPFTINTFED